MATAAKPDFSQFLLSSILTDVSADVMPDADAVLAIVETGGYEALIEPSNTAAVATFLVKLQADGLKTGNDLSKQIASFARQWLAAKIAALVPAAAVT